MLGEDSGKIDEEQYQIAIVPAVPIINSEIINVTYFLFSD